MGLRTAAAWSALLWVLLLLGSVGAPPPASAQVQDGATMTVLRGQVAVVRANGSRPGQSCGQVCSCSPFRQQPTSISKYCVGVGLLVADVEHDAFEEQLKAIESLTRASPYKLESAGPHHGTERA